MGCRWQRVRGCGVPEISWRFEAEDEVSVHQAVVDGTVYATSADGHVYALDADTGELHWRYSIGLRSHPYLAISGMIFVGGGRGTLHALDPATGEARWGLQRGIYQIFPALVVEDVLYAVSGDGHAYAFDVFTGKMLWRYTYRAGHGLGYVPTVADGVLYVGSDDHHVYALDATSGALLWRFYNGWRWCDPHLRWLMASSTSAQKAGYAYALDSKTGELLWRYSIGGGMQGAPVVDNGVIYVSSYSGFVYALEARPGE